MRLSLISVLLMGLALAACGDDGSAMRSEDETAQVVARAAELRPDDYALAQIYTRSCRGCHANPASGAPLTGDGEAWAPRIAQGSRTLLDHTIRGFNGMPPLGMCPDCDLADFRALIAFMSTDPDAETSE